MREMSHMKRLLPKKKLIERTVEKQHTQTHRQWFNATSLIDLINLHYSRALKIKRGRK